METEPLHRYKISEGKETGREGHVQAQVQPDTSPIPEPIQSSPSQERVVEKKEPVQADLQADLSPEPVGIPGGVCTVQPGNSFWSIAQSFYMDPYLWPNIFRANSDVVLNPDRLKVGLPIHVPSLEGTPGSLSKNDLVNIIDGYMQVYLAYNRLGKGNARYYLWVANQYRMPQVWQKYEDRIEESDRDYVLRIKGSPRL
jgi:hypothetical protein